MDFARCIVCGAGFPACEKIHHMKSDWHIYNLKRSIASLPPISKDAFLTKQALLLSNNEHTHEPKTYCEPCKRGFKSEKSLECHLSSKKHKDCLATQKCEQKPTETSSCINEIDECETIDAHALPLGSCLFCDKRALGGEDYADQDLQNTFLANRVLDHMVDAHQFFVPFADKLIDPAGLLVELGKIVGEELACIACGKQFNGPNKLGTYKYKACLNALRSHMLNKQGHKHIWCGKEDPVQIALDIAQSCDNEDGTVSVYPPVALAGGELFSQFYDQSVIASSFILPEDDEIYEVRLQSGTIIGHRKLRTIYQQHLGSFSQAVALGSPPPSTKNANNSSHEVVPSHLNLVSNHSWSNQQRIYAEEHKRSELKLGILGNLCNRSRLRKQC